MSFLNKLLGRPLASSEEQKEKLSVWTGVPVLGLDALASTGYGPEAGLTILLPLGLLGLKYFPIIILLIVFNLLTLYLSYRQTAAAYPGGGGSYIVASDNFGKPIGVWTAVMLLLDYLLNVCVSIAAGVGALVSAVPWLHPHVLPLCLFVLTTLTLLNLRGIHQSGLAFVIPVIVFVACMGAALLLGVFKTGFGAGQPIPIVAPPTLPSTTASLSVWIILAAFANGSTAMTGIEAVSNGVPLFRKPAVPNAQRTLTIIMLILGCFLIAIAYICPSYHIGAMDETQPGYQTILSQIVAAVAGRNVFYYITLASIFIVLTYSAQTSYTDFPRVARLLAEDGFLPSYFANRGRRLVYSDGIILLAVLCGLLLVAFKGVTNALIPLFAVGAFGAFLVSQTGMIRHWLRNKGRGYQTKLAFNLIGAITTAAALLIIVIAKFLEGAWITVVFVPVLTFSLISVRRHYKRVTREIETPLTLETTRLQHPVIVMPFFSWNRVTEKALHFALNLSEDITALHVTTEKDHQYIKKQWTEKVEKPVKRTEIAMPKLVIIPSPYRRINEPILEFLRELRKEKPDRLIAVMIPELVEPHWYEYILHTMNASRLRSAILSLRDPQIVVISTPWYVR